MIHPRHGVAVAASLLGVLVLVVMAHSLARATPAPAYSYETSLAGGVEYVEIDLLDQYHLSTGAEDYSVYKASSDQRIDDWLAQPALAPPIEGIEVAITFKRPQTGSGVAAVLSGLDFQVERVLLVESLSTGRRGVSEWYGPLDGEAVAYFDELVAAGPQPSWLCEQAPRHEGCFDVTTTGIMMLFGRFTAGGLAGLGSLRRNPQVYLVDSTAIDYLAQHPAASATVVDLPWALWTNSSQVAWP